jgi:hypothetical protein
MVQNIGIRIILSEEMSQRGDIFIHRFSTFDFLWKKCCGDGYK